MALVVTLLSALMLMKFTIYFAQTIELTEIIQTNKGPVQGQILTTVQKKIKYSAFKAIPFAKPPFGYLRFKSPEEPDSWNDVLVAVNESNACPQWNELTHQFIGNEDCLYLNVYTPKINSDDNKQRAVMVWIYGGGFQTGSVKSTLYGPDFLIEDDVVIVAMNYRLGAFGFLSVNHRNASGNAGLKDQNFALQWTQNNINLFGGDPTKVTIFGQSAGSASVELHLMSDLSVGLFSSSIGMSGTPLAYWGFHSPETAESSAFYLGRILGINTFNKDELLRKLYSVNADKIIAATRQLNTSDFPFKPTYEDVNIAINPFLTDCPMNKYSSGNFSEMPHMLGFTRSETLALVLSIYDMKKLIAIALESTDSNFTTHLPYIDKLRKLANDLKSNDADVLSENFVDELVNITTDLLFITGIDQTQKYVSRKAPVYYYCNSFDYDDSVHRVFGINFNGTAHGDDIPHIFWIPSLHQSLDPLSDIGIQRTKMVRMWTNFAKYGNPTPQEKSDSVLNFVWPVSGSEGFCLEIDNKNYSIGPRPIDNFVSEMENLLDIIRVQEGCPPFVP